MDVAWEWKQTAGYPGEGSSLPQYVYCLSRLVRLQGYIDTKHFIYNLP